MIYTVYTVRERGRVDRARPLLIVALTRQEACELAFEVFGRRHPLEATLDIPRSNREHRAIHYMNTNQEVPSWMQP